MLKNVFLKGWTETHIFEIGNFFSIASNDDIKDSRVLKILRQVIPQSEVWLKAANFVQIVDGDVEGHLTFLADFNGGIVDYIQIPQKSASWNFD